MKESISIPWTGMSETLSTLDREGEGPRLDEKSQEDIRQGLMNVLLYQSRPETALTLSKPCIS